MMVNARFANLLLRLSILRDLAHISWDVPLIRIANGLVLYRPILRILNLLIKFAPNVQAASW